MNDERDDGTAAPSIAAGPALTAAPAAVAAASSEMPTTGRRRRTVQTGGNSTRGGVAAAGGSGAAGGAAAEGSAVARPDGPDDAMSESAASSRPVYMRVRYRPGRHHGYLDVHSYLDWFDAAAGLARLERAIASPASALHRLVPGGGLEPRSQLLLSEPVSTGKYE